MGKVWIDGFECIHEKKDRNTGGLPLALKSWQKQFLTTFKYVRVVGSLRRSVKYAPMILLPMSCKKDFDAAHRKTEQLTNPFHPVEDISEDMIEEIENVAFKEATTLGGSTKTFATGVKPGLGSYSNVFNKVDSKIGRYFMSIPSVKEFI